MSDDVKIKKSKVSLVLDILYYVVVCSLIAICVSIIIQQQLDRNKIPHIFGYKLFMINKDFMDETLTEGDLVFTKNVDSKSLKIGDIVAFRNSQNLVTIHEIIDITKSSEKVEYTMQTLENEVKYNKYVSDERIEGILVLKIPMLGKILLFLIEPICLGIMIAIILVIGYIMYMIAKKKNSKS